MDEKLQELVTEVQQLKERVAYLEEKTGFTTLTSHSQVHIKPLATEVAAEEEKPLAAKAKKSYMPNFEFNLMEIRE